MADDAQSWVTEHAARGDFGKPGEFVVEIIDTHTDYDWQVKICYANRLKEYPAIGDQLDALMKYVKGDDKELKAIADQCFAVKAK